MSTEQIVMVQVVVEVGCGVWDPKCSMQQVADQARKEALQRVGNMLGTSPAVRVVKATVVEVILREKEMEGFRK